MQVRILSLLILVNFVCLVSSTDPNKDISRTLCEVANARNLACQEHQVITEDKYILKMFRLPGDLNKPFVQKPVVYIQHGILDSADAFVYNDDYNSLATVLASQGYDVWLGNNRGNKYSMTHETLSNHFWNQDYWSFSFQEMGLKDVPAMLDYIQKSTGKEKVVYIGHSEGTSQMFAALSDPVVAPQIEDKISLFISLAPVIRMDNSAGLLWALSQAYTGEALELLFIYEMLWADPALADSLAWLCKEIEIICIGVGELIGQLDPSATSWPRARVLLSKFPSGASTTQCIHYEQIIRDHKFQKFDFGSSTNLRVYGTTTPPLWDITKIKVPMVWYTAGQDILADPQDVKMSEDLLKPHGYLKHVKNIEIFGHLGFMWSNISSTAYFPDLLTQLKTYSLE